MVCPSFITTTTPHACMNLLSILSCHFADHWERLRKTFSVCLMTNSSEREKTPVHQVGISMASLHLPSPKLSSLSVIPSSTYLQPLLPLPPPFVSSLHCGDMPSFYVMCNVAYGMPACNMHMLHICALHFQTQLTRCSLHSSYLLLVFSPSGRQGREEKAWHASHRHVFSELSL